MFKRISKFFSSVGESVMLLGDRFNKLNWWQQIGVAILCSLIPVFMFLFLPTAFVKGFFLTLSFIIVFILPIILVYLGFRLYFNV